MKELLRKIEELKKSPVKNIIDSHVRGFSETVRNRERVFSELCFCILTANFNAERAIKIQNSIGNDFCTLDEGMLSLKLRQAGHRFPNTRANYIVNSQKYRNELLKALKSLNEYELREWLITNIKGLGMKEASHFMRNVGFKNVAIIDFHIMDLLVKEKLIHKSEAKSLSKNQYLKIEDVLRGIAGKAGLNLAELDLYLWYMETGKVLK